LDFAEKKVHFEVHDDAIPAVVSRVLLTVINSFEDFYASKE